ncbi:MAG: hypothetical protein HKN04_08935, partial [Rhodothermaceae bacterium]|nr:hypothetical protein [Rhodothermaceae bacterium]
PSEGTVYVQAPNPFLDLIGPMDTTRVGVAVGQGRLTVAATPTLPRHRHQYDRFVNHPPYRVERPGEGPVGYIDLDIAPPVVIDLDPSPIRLVPGENTIPVQVQTYDPEAEAMLLMLTVMPGDYEGDLIHDELLEVVAEATEATFQFMLPDTIAPGSYQVMVRAVTDPESRSAEPFLALTNNRSYAVTRPAAVLPDVSVTEGLRVGFVRSYDQVTENALRAMGAEVVVLDSTALATRDLSDLDAIVLDIRAYLVRADLRQYNARLLDWVRSGGHLVVGYHKTFEWNPGQTSGGFFGEVIDVPDEGFAPYPLMLGRDRVTFEDAPVTLLQPEHVLFRLPHAITPADWDGWVQERGLYFPATYDDRYTELLAMSDPGEGPLRGSLLLADVGEGTYLYTALGWYRQLEALNPGAWRLFANLVSYPRTDPAPVGERGRGH